MSISLKEATEIVERCKGNPNSLLEEDGIVDLLIAMDTSATDIMQSVPDEQLQTMVMMFMAVVCQDLLEEGEMKLMLRLLSDAELFGKIVSSVSKMSIGLAALEEWR